MKRMPVPWTPFEGTATLTDFRISQIIAVEALAMLHMERYPNFRIHEPGVLGLVSGGNLINAEGGVNARDLAWDTLQGRGLDVGACRRMLYEAGFAYLRCGDDTLVPLTAEYIKSNRAL